MLLTDYYSMKALHIKGQHDNNYRYFKEDVGIVIYFFFK